MACAFHEGMILVADQNRSTAELLVRRLRADGFQADAASSSTAVLRRVEAGGVAAVVLDPGLPGAPYDAITKIRSRAQTQSLPIIVFGTSDRGQDSSAAISAGASAFLVKGRVSPTQLVGKLREIMSAASGGVDRKPDSGAYYVAVKPEGDANRLASDLGAGPGMRCPDCKGSLSLYLQRDLSRWGQWLFGTFGCIACVRKSASNVVPIADDITAGGAS